MFGGGRPPLFRDRAVIAPVSHWSCRSRREAQRVLKKLRLLESWTRDPSRRKICSDFLLKYVQFLNRKPRLILYSYLYNKFTCIHKYLNLQM